MDNGHGNGHGTELMAAIGAWETHMVALRVCRSRGPVHDVVFHERSAWLQRWRSTGSTRQHCGPGRRCSTLAEM